MVISLESNAPKSSVLRSFVHHRRNQSEGTHLPSGLSLVNGSPHLPLDYRQHPKDTTPTAMVFSQHDGGALGELHQNHQDNGTSRSPRKAKDDRHDHPHERRGRSPTKSAFSTLSRMAKRDPSRGTPKTREPSPEKPKKAKSSTNLAGLLSRPKSSKNLGKLANEEQRPARDKENRTPPSSTPSTEFDGHNPPIYAQFRSIDPSDPRKGSFESGSAHGSHGSQEGLQMRPKFEKERPKSFQPGMASSRPAASTRDDTSLFTAGRNLQSDPRQPAASERAAKKTQRPKIFTAFSASGQKKDRSAPDPIPGDHINPTDINAHLEAMLDRRNIPENQRFKMRNLNDTIKMEFIRQDWAEMAAKAAEPNDGTPIVDTTSAVVGAETDTEDSHPKRTRGRSFTLGRAKKDLKLAGTKKSKGEGTLGRHLRSKSTESVTSERPSSAGSITPSGGSGFFSKIKSGHNPSDFVTYLRKVQKPEVVEVGKLHKLRLLLRNETVSWTESFIEQGGMKEIVGLLNRILEVEWREEHEDALLHENLLCLKALCTTALALQYLDSIQTDLFPKLVHMIFDPEKKGPSEFTTRNIITCILFTYIESASPQERVIRTKAVLSHLRNPEPKEDKRPVPFVLEMHKERPYTVWNKEVVSVTKEVFWIFLHSLNVVALPADMSSKGGAQIEATMAPQFTGMNDNVPYAFMHKHFPQPRPPVPAAPYVGGVEWDATNYLASHLDLVNAILACTSTAAQRNTLRAELRISGWERCMGGSMRLCKEKFYGCVHEALRTWVAAAVEDGWDVRDVRYGPPPDASRSPKRKPGGGAKNGASEGAGEQAAPRIEMPKLDFALPAPNFVPHGQQGSNQKENDAWL